MKRIYSKMAFEPGLKKTSETLTGRKVLRSSQNKESLREKRSFSRRRRAVTSPGQTLEKGNYTWKITEKCTLSVPETKEGEKVATVRGEREALGKNVTAKR